MSEDSTTKKQIVFLTGALETGAIECLGNAEYNNSDKMSTTFKSLLFKEDFSDKDFDKDIFDTISDRRILADKLNQCIKDGKIIVDPDMVPSFFEKNEYSLNHQFVKKINF